MFRLLTIQIINVRGAFIYGTSLSGNKWALLILFLIFCRIVSNQNKKLLEIRIRCS